MLHAVRQDFYTFVREFSPLLLRLWALTRGVHHQWDDDRLAAALRHGACSGGLSMRRICLCRPQIRGVELTT